MNQATAKEEEIGGDVELRDAFAIDYELLPAAPVEKKTTLWEIFLLGWQHFSPRFPDRTEVTIVRGRRPAHK